MYLNSIVVEGNLTGDAQVKKAGTVDVLDCRIVVDGTRRNDRPDCVVGVSVYGAYGLAIQGFMTKGAHVVVFGTLHTTPDGRYPTIHAARVIEATKGDGGMMAGLADAFADYVESTDAG